jgi:hypothetical protein
MYHHFQVCIFDGLPMTLTVRLDATVDVADFNVYRMHGRKRVAMALLV